MNCLYDMMYDDLKKVVEDVLHLEYWCVRDDDLKSRMESIADSDRFKELKERATEKGYAFNDIEIVTWLDTLNILYYVFDKIEDLLNDGCIGNIAEIYDADEPREANGALSQAWSVSAMMFLK